MMTCNFLVLVIVDNEDRLVGGRIDKLADFKVFLDFTFCSWSTQLVPKKKSGIVRKKRSWTSARGGFADFSLLSKR